MEKENNNLNDGNYAREPITERLIKDVTKNDKRIAILGVLVSKNDESSTLVFNDGETQITGIVSTDEMMKSFEIGTQYRFIGVPLFYDEGFELRIEQSQEMKKLSKTLYIKTFNKIIWQK